MIPGVPDGNADIADGIGISLLERPCLIPARRCAGTGRPDDRTTGYDRGGLMRTVTR